MPENGDMVTLHEHLNEKIAALEKLIETNIAAIEKAIAVQHAATEQAVALASDALSKRLDAGNEIRAALDDLSRLMARRTELETAITALRAEITATLGSLESDVRTLREDKSLYATKADVRPLEDYQVSLKTKASQGAFYLSVGLSVVGIVLSILLHFI